MINSLFFTPTKASLDTATKSYLTTIAHFYEYYFIERSMRIVSVRTAPTVLLSVRLEARTSILALIYYTRVRKRESSFLKTYD